MIFDTASKPIEMKNVNFQLTNSPFVFDRINTSNTKGEYCGFPRNVRLLLRLVTLNAWVSQNMRNKKPMTDGGFIMKGIRNIDSLVQRMRLLDDDWQKTIYEATGVILSESLHLYSNCGCVALDQDVEYSWESGKETTEYCDINSIKELISYIKEMQSFSALLTDVSYGKFTKSELFWGVCERVLLQHDNLIHKDGTMEREWGLYSIEQCENGVALHMALIACDSCDIWLEVSRTTTLESALKALVDELNSNCDYIKWLPAQKVYEVSYSVPQSYDELKAKSSKGGIFDWLNL